MLSVPVEHEPWSLSTAEVVELDETLWTSLDLPPRLGPAVVHLSPGVDARLGWPQLAHDASRS